MAPHGGPCARDRVMLWRSRDSSVPLGQAVRQWLAMLNQPMVKRIWAQRILTDAWAVLTIAIAIIRSGPAHGGSVLMDGMAALALVLQHVGKMSRTAHASVALIPELFSRESNGQLKQPPAGHSQSPGTAVQKLCQRKRSSGPWLSSSSHRGCVASVSAESWLPGRCRKQKLGCTLRAL